MIWHKTKPWNCCSLAQKFPLVIVSGHLVLIVSVLLGVSGTSRLENWHTIQLRLVSLLMVLFGLLSPQAPSQI